MSLSPRLRLGETTIERLGFGAMQLTGDGFWGPPPDHDEAIAVLRRAVELGVDFVDTADSYGPMVSEMLIAEALHPYGSVRVATKAGLRRPGPGVWELDGRPERLTRQLEVSLRCLRVDAVDLWQLHRIDPAIPREDQFGVLAAAVASGKARAVGLSEVTVEDIVAAQAVVPIASVQNRFHLLNTAADPVLEHCEANGIAFIPWHPLANGAVAADAGLGALAASWGLPAPVVALAWLLARSPVMVPIPGTRRLAHLEENMRARAVTLDADQLAQLATPRAGGRGPSGAGRPS